MAFSFLRFAPGGASDPKLRTDENASNEHVALVKLDVGVEGANSLVAGLVPIREQGADDFAHNQVTVTSTITQIIATRAKRRRVTIQNLSAVEVFLGGASVATTSGLLLPAARGAAVVLNTSKAVSGRTAGSSATVAYIEEFDT